MRRGTHVEEVEGEEAGVGGVGRLVRHDGGAGGRTTNTHDDVTESHVTRGVEHVTELHGPTDRHT